MSIELILASTSPRRRELITHLNLPFRTITVDVDETPLPGEKPHSMVLRLAQWKAASAFINHTDSIVVAADTIVEIDDSILGKPSDSADAVRMLKLLRGRAHQVYSGVVVKGPEHEVVQLSETVVWMRDYADSEIISYVATGDPLDKAAAYAIQHPGFQPVSRIEGCYANVMGLPLCRVYLGLLEFGIHAPNAATIFKSHYESNCPTARQILAK